MAEIKICDIKGVDKGAYKVSDSLSSLSARSSVIHRAIIAEQANSRQGTQSALTRAEVRGGGRKPYKQKKTGNARQGSIRSPHYRHGGMVFAVKPRSYEKKVNRKERRKAMIAAFNHQVELGLVTVLDSIRFTEIKTKNAIQLLKNLGLQDAKRILVVLSECDEITYRCFRNLPNVEVRTAPRLSKGDSQIAEVKTAPFSTRDLAVARTILIDKEAMKYIEEYATL